MTAAHISSMVTVFRGGDGIYSYIEFVYPGIKTSEILIPGY